MNRNKLVLKTFTCCFAVFILLFYIVSCKKDSSGPDGTSSGNVSAKITVLDENGLPVSSAKVSIGSVSAISGGDGVASLAGASAEAGKINVKVEKDGFFVGFRNLAFLGAEQHSTVVKLISQQKIGTIDASASATLSGTDFKVEVTGQGFLDSAGNPVTGNVEVYAKYINAADPEKISELMPGGDFAAIGQGGEDGTLESYGFTAIDFKDKNGKRIIPKSGNAKVGIKLPAAALAEVNANGADLWYFDDIAKIWVYGGVANPVGQEVYMPVTSASFGNCDKLKKKATIKGQLTCGSAILGLEAIRLKTSGVGYSRVYSTSTNANGKFSVEVAVEDSGSKYGLYVKGKYKEYTLNAGQTLDIGKENACLWFIEPPICPGQPTVSDIDGNIYHTVKIGDQCWLRENLRTSRFSNGESIPIVTSPTEWLSSSQPASCYYENSQSNEGSFGKLYNWYVATSSKNVCPTGWHVPTDNEFVTLFGNSLNALEAGKELSSKGIVSDNTGLWNSFGGTNESGFSAVPGGGRIFGQTDVIFLGKGERAIFWTRDQAINSSNGYLRVIQPSFVGSQGDQPKGEGYSIRCVKD